jgi:hypothetical protein
MGYDNDFIGRINVSPPIDIKKLYKCLRMESSNFNDLDNDFEFFECKYEDLNDVIMMNPLDYIKKEEERDTGIGGRFRPFNYDVISSCIYADSEKEHDDISGIYDVSLKSIIKFFEVNDHVCNGEIIMHSQEQIMIFIVKDNVVTHFEQNQIIKILKSN